MKNIFITFIYLFITEDGFSQDVIYLKENKNNINNYTIGKVTKIVNNEALYDKDNVKKKINVDNIVAVFNSLGKFILGDDLTNSFKRAYFFDKSKTPEKDIIVYSEPFKLIYGDIVYESEEIINYRTKDGQAASSTKKEILLIIYSNGHHHFYSDPSNNINALKKAQEGINQIIKEEKRIIVTTRIPVPVEATTTNNAQPDGGGAKGGSYERKPKEFVVIPVYYATDRKPSGETEIKNFYSDERNIKNGIEVGKIEVTIPVESHEIGKLDVPKWWNFYKDDPNKFMQLESLHQMNQKLFFTELSNAIKLSDKKDAFIFVHGYNNSIEDAALRAAQLSYDLGFKGATIMYSWSSRSKAALYAADEDAVSWTIPLFKSFLSKVVTETKASNINIIAHSMGNRIITTTLKELQTENSTIKFNQVILAAPDIDLEVFKRDIAPKIVKSANQVTLYVSKKDNALLLSKEIHANERLGKRLVVINGIDTIDATELEVDDYFKHAYFVEARSVIEDIGQLIKFNATPKFRNLIQMKNNEGVYWKLKR